MKILYVPLKMFHQHLKEVNLIATMKLLVTRMSYNVIHARTRNIVERTFGIWKRRFPCLSKELTTKLLTSTTIVVACAVLHNLSLILNDKLEEEEEENMNDEVPVAQPHWQPGDGFVMRNALIERLFR